jgi:exodeoxyribonuclease V gamma subunit
MHLVRRGKTYPSDLLRGYVDQAVLAAAGLAAGDSFAAVVNPHADEAVARRFAGLKRADAETWLRELAGDLLSGVHDYLMPCEAVFDYEDRGRVRPLGDILASRLARQYSGLSSQWGPVRHIDRFVPPADADELIDRRFARYLAGDDREDSP